MAEERDVEAEAAAVAEIEAQAIAAEAAERAAAEAWKALVAGHDVALGKLAALRDALDDSLARAGEDPDHAAYTREFQRDVVLKADEIIAWIGRTLG